MFAVPLGEEARRLLFAAVTELRRAGVTADFVYGAKGLKGAMKTANRSGARYTLVAGERDLADGVVQLKDMETGEQAPVALDALVAELTPQARLRPSRAPGDASGGTVQRGPGRPVPALRKACL